MCFICFIWVIKQELLPTRHINLLTNNYIQCFLLRKKCKPMGNIFYRNIGNKVSHIVLCVPAIFSFKHCCTSEQIAPMCPFLISPQINSFFMETAHHTLIKYTLLTQLILITLKCYTNTKQRRKIILSFQNLNKLE